MLKAQQSLTVVVETPHGQNFQEGSTNGVWTGCEDSADNGVSANYGVSARWLAKTAVDRFEETCSGVTENGTAGCTVAERGATGTEVAGFWAMSADVAGPRATSADETEVAGFGAVDAVVAGHGATTVEEAENKVTCGCSTESSSDGEVRLSTVR
jgi:hypothetical protein